jgi:hypothetical protein
VRFVVWNARTRERRHDVLMVDIALDPIAERLPAP